MTAAVRSVAALGAVAALLTVLFVGCRQGAGDPVPTPRPGTSGLSTLNAGERVVPPGWTVHSAPGYSFAYPAEWTKTERDTEQGHVIEVNGPKGDGDLPRQLVVATQPGFTGDLDGLVTAFEFLRTLPQQVVVRDERAALDGAVEAQVTERTWQAPSVAGETPARVLELRLITPDRLSIGFLVRSAEADFSAARLRDVFATFRLTS